MRRISTKTQRSKRVGLKDVAHASRVSIATVSLVLTDHPGISEETKRRVWRCCAELGYRRREPGSRSDAGAGGAASGRKLGRVGFLLVGDLLQGPHYAMFLQSLASATGATGIGLQFAAVDAPSDLGLATDRAMALARDTQGLILMGMIDRVLLTALAAAGVPHVVVGHTMDSAVDPGVRMVCYDDIAMGYRATESLLAAGHRRIAFVCEQIIKGLSHWRWRAGYLLAITEAGLPVEPELICVSGKMNDTGDRAAEMVLAMSPRPSAYVIPSARIAAGFVAAMNRRGQIVPRESIVIAGEPVSLKLFHAEDYPQVGVSPAALAAASLDQIRRAYEEPCDRLMVVQVPFTCANLPEPQKASSGG